ncbi:MAG: GLPGLI family protein [Chitinophagaceae bacterium]|nr:GLPGLI family protein [Chitinophagaceae bacterium]
MKYLLFFFTIIHTRLLFSQDLYPVIYSCKYKSTFCKYPAQEKSNESELFNLKITAAFSKYFSEDKRVGDSILNENMKNGLSLKDRIANSKKYKSGKGGITIYNDNEHLAVFETVLINSYYYKDSLPAGKWMIFADTSLINNLRCQKASINFRGRSYIAWFALDIPLSYGPWKFYGLPGLIVKISDTKGHYSFELINFSKADDTLSVQENACIKTGLKKIMELKKKIAEDPFRQFEMATGASVKIVGDEQKKLEFDKFVKKSAEEYNPIELTIED